MDRLDGSCGITNAMTSGSAYLIGRTIRASLDQTQSASDSAYASLRVDGLTYDGITFSHCTFANVSFKGCTLKNVRFVNCVFLDCYFRDTAIVDCKFSASKFIDCDLGKLDLRTTDLKYYNSFVNCFIKYREIRESLPTEGNLKFHLCSNLAAEARRAGALNDEGLYRQAGASALEEHLLSAVRGSSHYFRNKYRGVQRISALGEYIASRTRGYLWGYRRSWTVVMRNWALLTLGVFPLFFYMCRSGIERSGKPASTGDLWVASIGNILPGSGLSDVKFTSSPCLILAFIEVLTGLVFTGIVAALIFRTVFERWR